MAVTVQQLLTDAKRLVTRLREQDNSADSLISQAQKLNNNLDVMKEYHSELEQLNGLAHQRPHSSLILNIQQENRHIRELQQENRELRTMVEEHQSALELIMNKYREQTEKMAQTLQLEKTYAQKDNTQELQKRTEKLSEMAAVMKKAIEIDDENYAKEQELLEKLTRENKLFRELLEISKYQQMGLACKLRIKMNDEGVQTDL